MFNDDEVEITFFRSSGPGGQHRNVTDSAVRVRHIPTGIVVVVQRHRSQHRNRQEALAELQRRLEARRVKPKPRRRTKPTRSSKERRLKDKKAQGEKKRLRKAPFD
jgi:protein subunit release factor B